MADRKKIKAFVQGVLGCGCEEDVFQITDLRREQMAGHAYDRVNIGNRLLIYIFSSDDPEWIKSQLPGIVRAGKAERDARGFNRFRIVVATDAPQVKRAAPEAYQRAHVTDDRVHLHVVGKAQVAF